MDSYTHTRMFTGLDELLQFDNAAKIIRNAEGANKTIDPNQWSDAGCRELAKQAASSFLGPAVQHLEKIETLLVWVALASNMIPTNMVLLIASGLDFCRLVTLSLELLSLLLCIAL